MRIQYLHLYVADPLKQMENSLSKYKIWQIFKINPLNELLTLSNKICTFQMMFIV